MDKLSINIQATSKQLFGHDFFGIAPKALNVIPSPLVGLEEMHHQVHKVQHNPSGMFVTAALPSGLALLSGMLLHEIGDRPHLAIRGTGDHKDPVHNLGKIPNVQQANVAAVIVLGQFGQLKGERFGSRTLFRGGAASQWISRAVA